MISYLRKMGIRSDHMYWAGAASIVISFASWLISNQYEDASLARADRWGIFVGEWAPTFFALGVALAIDETHATRKDDMLQREDTRRKHEPAMAK
jgi:hypothetical protein